jgi:hypothetical protein
VIHYRYRETRYHIVVTQVRPVAATGRAVRHLTLDGVELKEQAIRLVDDRREHQVQLSVESAQRGQAG